MKRIRLLALAISLLVLPTVVQAVNIGDIVTVAGGGVGDNGPATLQCLNRPIDVTVDSSGNLYIADYFNNRIRKVDGGTGIITTVAGNGVAGFSGDNGAATSASLYWPTNVTVDSSGNVYFSDAYNHRVRKVNSGTGIITTVAGNGVAGFSGDNGAATSACLNYPGGITLDSSGNLYIADNNRIRKVDSATGIITTFAGNGTSGFSGDNGAATSASFNFPATVAADSSDNLYITDNNNHRIRRVDGATGIITTVAGNGTQGFSGDGGAATAASLNMPYGVTVDSSGNLYFGELNNNRIRKVDGQTGIITTVAGNGTAGFSGDNGPATSASLDWPRGVTVDSSGNLYFADHVNNRVRKVASGTGIITTVAGNGTRAYAGDNGPATSASFDYPRGGVTIDSTGNVYVPDYTNHRIRKVSSATGIVTTVAGNGLRSFSGDNGPAISASLQYPSGVAIDSNGDVFIADRTNHRIRKLSIGTGIITTVAGNGFEDFSGDNGPATSASLSWPSGVTFDSSGNLYIADYGNHRIRKVASGTGIITTVAGNGTAGFSGDGGAAIAAGVYRPDSVIVDSSGNLYFSMSYSHRVRKVDSGTGIITTVAGNGIQGYGGDNGPATSASLNYPSSVTLDSSGNLYIADEWNHRVRKVESGTGVITTVAGNGTYDFSGDNGPATSANVYDPAGVTIDSSGNLYITEWGSGRIRKVYLTAAPTVTALVSSAVDNSSVSGTAVTFTATVTSKETVPANTTVTFKDGGATIGSGVLDATGRTTFTTSSLAVGSHSITASYADTGILAGSTSQVLVQTVVIPPIATTVSASAITVSSATLNGTVSGDGGTATTFFEYGTTQSYGSSAMARGVTAGSGATIVSAGISSLACNTTYHFRVVATNAAGTSRGSDGTFATSACITQTPDTAPPALSISTLADGSVTRNSTLNICGKITSATGVKAFTINGNTVTTDKNGNFSYPITLQDGLNAIVTAVTDNQDKQTSDTRTISLDITAPALTVTAPADNSATAQHFVTVTGTAGETSAILLAVNGGSPEFAAMTGNTFTGAVNLVAGSNTIIITAIDLAGKTTAVKRTIVSDRSNLALTFTDPDQDITIRLNGYLVKGSATEPYSPTTITITAGGVTYTPTVGGDGTFQQQVNLSAEGTYPVVVKAANEAGASTTIQRNIIYTLARTGDVNGDGVVDIGDALLALQIAIGNHAPTEAELRRGDVGPLVSDKPNPDGIIDAGDALLILEKIVGVKNW